MVDISWPAKWLGEMRDLWHCDNRVVLDICLWEPRALDERFDDEHWTAAKCWDRRQRDSKRRGWAVLCQRVHVTVDVMTLQLPVLVLTATTEQPQCSQCNVEREPVAS